jgi:hypothetical protein
MVNRLKIKSKLIDFIMTTAFNEFDSEDEKVNIINSFYEIKSILDSMEDDMSWVEVYNGDMVFR